MYDYLCSLCAIRYSTEYSLILTKKGQRHCVFCVDEKREMAEFISEKEKKKVRNEYIDEFDKKMFLHRLN